MQQLAGCRHDKGDWTEEVPNGHGGSGLGPRLATAALFKPACKRMSNSVAGQIPKFLPRDTYSAELEWWTEIYVIRMGSENTCHRPL